MAVIKVLLPTGFGENCAAEAAAAFEAAGAKSTIAHIQDIIDGKVDLHAFHIFNWGGGFLDGDELGSAKAGANRLMLQRIIGREMPLIDELLKFRDDGKLIGGQCNGFQLWVKAGLLPGFESKKQQASLVRNDSGRFEDRWVRLKANKKSPCVWTKGVDSMFLPVRHGEGKLVLPQGSEGEQTLAAMRRKNLIALQYVDVRGKIADKFPDNPNGSTDAIAGLCDETGRVFALMPHPEAYITPYTHPFWTRLKADCERSKKPFPEHGDGFRIFKNAVEYVKEELL